MGHRPATWGLRTTWVIGAWTFRRPERETPFDKISPHVELAIVSRNSKSVDVPIRQHRRLRASPGARSKVRLPSLSDKHIPGRLL